MSPIAGAYLSCRDYSAWLGIPAVVGCGDATERLKEGHTVTVSCAEGDTGYVYDELLDFDVTQFAGRYHAGPAAEGDDERG